MLTQRRANLPAPAADGNVYVAEYLLDRWVARNVATLGWLGDSRTETAYTINGRVYHYQGLTLAPKVNSRRRTFFVAVLAPVTK